MKRIFFSLVAMLCLFGSVATAQTVKQKVAVYVTGDADAGYKKVIGSKMVSGITRSDSYIAVERTADFLAELAKEQDYQTSGAVSDNQIVRLGQQFGVRYVLVADISEVFDSMFVAARLIDVQTGQITGAAEASSVVNSMDGLTELAENVIADLVDGDIRSNSGNGISIAGVKILGPFSYADLHTFSQKIPVGYRVASKAEIESLIISYRKARKQMAFPIYAGITIVDRSSGSYPQDYYITASYYESEDMAAVELNNYNYYRKSGESSWRNIEKIKTGYIYLMEN